MSSTSAPSSISSSRIRVIAAASAAAIAGAAALSIWYIRSRQCKERGDSSKSVDTSITSASSASPSPSVVSSASSSSTSSSCTAATHSNENQNEKKVVVIGTRSSQLALWQAHHVQDLLSARYPHLTFKVQPMNTMGDVDQIKPLSDFASKGVFTKELDIATLNDTIQLAVHCVKDLPTTLPDGLYMGAIMSRGDTEDVLVLPASHPKHGKGGSFDDLPAGAVIGTSAMRRTAAIAKYYPHLKCENIRGNVNTRLAKLDRGDYAALLLARVGLQRLGFQNRISAVLDSHKFGYAVGQGALGIVCRDNDAATKSLLAALDDTETRWACEAERAVLRTLQGGCKVPIAIRTTIDHASKKYLAAHPRPASDSSMARDLHVWCTVMSMDGKVDVHANQTQTIDSFDENGDGSAKAAKQARELGESLGQKLLKKGADKLLEGIIDREGTGLRAPSSSSSAAN